MEPIEFDMDILWYLYLGNSVGVTSVEDEVEYEVMTEAVLDDQLRWSIITSQVISMGSKFYRFCWQEPATERQEIPYNERLIDVTEVFPKEVTQTIYTETN